MFFYEFSSEPPNLLPQNRCFVRGIRQFSSHLTKCHACHRSCTLSPLDAALTIRFAKTRNTIRLKCCACHAKWRWTRPKCCACHENCNASSENVAKVLRLPHKTTFDTLRNTSECHEVPRKPKQRDVWNLQKWPLLQTYHRHGHTPLARTVADGSERLRTVANGCGRLRTVADGCEHKRNVERTHPQPPDPQSETGTLATHSGKRNA